VKSTVVNQQIGLFADNEKPNLYMHWIKESKY